MENMLNIKKNSIVFWIIMLLFFREENEVMEKCGSDTLISYIFIYSILWELQLENVLEFFFIILK